MADGYPDEIPLMSGEYQAVSMQHVLATGFAGIYSTKPKDGVKIDLTTESEGRKAILGMIDSAVSQLSRSASIRSLLAKPSWNISDREQWERSIANVVRDVVHDEPRFGSYRLDKKKERSPISLTEITKDTNFHCEPMAALMGVVVQKIENHFLEPSEDKINLKRRTDYYLTAGVLYQSAFQANRKPKDQHKAVIEGELLHGYVVSPITANFFEGTQGRPSGWHDSADSPYQKNDIKGYTFEDYLAGFPTLAESKGFSVGYDGSVEAQRLARERRAAISRGEFTKLSELRVDFLTMRVKDDTTKEEREVINPKSIGQQFADERNLLKALGACPDVASVASHRHRDTVTHIDKLLGESFKDSGRSYPQLACDAGAIEFAMTPGEVGRASIGSRILHWSNTKNFASEIVKYGLQTVSGRKEWTEKQLVEYLTAKGVNDVWINRVIPSDATPTANNFEQAVKTYYDSLPKSNLIMKSSQGDERISFETYLKLCRAEYTARGGKIENINASGTVVPVIYNPVRLYALDKQSNGRTNEEYISEEIIAGAFTTASISNRPGVESDKVEIKAVGIINGASATLTHRASLEIPESVGELPDPLPTKPTKETKHPEPRTARP